MRRRTTDVAVAVGFGAVDFLVILVPAVAVRSEVLNAGVGSMDDDVLAASAALGVVHCPAPEAAALRGTDGRPPAAPVDRRH